MFRRAELYIPFYGVSGEVQFKYKLTPTDYFELMEKNDEMDGQHLALVLKQQIGKATLLL